MASALRERRGGRAPDGGDDLLAVDVEDALLVTAHEVDVELTDAERGELAQFRDVLVGLADHAEAVDGLVVHECGVRGPRLGVVVIVVAGPAADVGGEIRGKSLLAIALHEVDDVILYERGEPTDPV